MRILITGAKGQLGSQIANLLKRRTSKLGKISNEYDSALLLGVSKEELDITSLKNIREVLYGFKPTVVINTAAFTDVDACETNIDTAFKVNALGPKNLAIACEEIRAKLIHISTDYVFSGDRSIPYGEHDMPKPANIYGKTKHIGEQYVREFSRRYFIIRTSWLYGYNGKNFVKTIIKASKERGFLEVVDDQRGSPTNAEDLAYHILKIALTEEYGIYHCSGKGSCSWYDFASKIIEFSNINCHIAPIKSDRIERLAKRPSYSLLDNMMLRCTVGDEMRHWEDALKEFIEELGGRV